MVIKGDESCAITKKTNINTIQNGDGGHIGHIIGNESNEYFLSSKIIYDNFAWYFKTPTFISSFKFWF